jgi:hypothetical protein
MSDEKFDLDDMTVLGEDEQILFFQKEDKEEIMKKLNSYGVDVLEDENKILKDEDTQLLLKSTRIITIVGKKDQKRTTKNSRRKGWEIIGCATLPSKDWLLIRKK